MVSQSDFFHRRRLQTTVIVSYTSPPSHTKYSDGTAKYFVVCFYIQSLETTFLSQYFLETTYCRVEIIRLSSTNFGNHFLCMNASPSAPPSVADDALETIGGFVIFLPRYILQT